MMMKLMGRGPARREPSSFLKVIRMSTKRLYLIILMLAIGCQQAGISSTPPAFGANATNGATAEAKPDKQLDINKNALLEGPSEEIRIKAAIVMLGSENPLARKILVDGLMQTKNSAARIAVCKALIQTRSSDGQIKNKEDFIQPLFSVFDTDVAAEAQLAAEAMLIYEYGKIEKSLEAIVTDASKRVRTRINAIHALRLWPDMEATIRLIRLVDDPEKQVSAEAENALHSLGIPVGENYWTREQNIIELRSKGRDEFLREWLIRQEAQMRQMRVELNSWQNRYQSALSKIYDGISDDGARGKFLAEHLGSSEAVIKLWALEKVSQWRKGTNPKLPTALLEPILVNLISDADRNVRLKTVTLLSLMVELNSAQQLLAQLEAEPDDQVKTGLLDALGGACSYTLLPSSPVKISPEIRKQALGWAAKYLSEEDAGKARKGAEVLRKLLEPEGIKPEELDGYLGLLAKRYSQQQKPDGALRGELLSAMAGLCSQGSAAKAKAAALFGPLFIEALRDETNFVRETAVDGLIYIDKSSALRRLRKDFVNDPSEILRKKLINLAGEIGGKEDLTWLSEKIGSNSESGPAWQAMIKIFDGSDSSILNEWMDKFTSQSSKIKLSEEQKIAFLKKAEAKAQSENRTEMLKEVRERLAELYQRIGQFDRAAEYLDRLYKAARTSEEIEAILPNLLDVYLRSSKLDLASELVGTCLAKNDMSGDNAVLVSIDNYLSKPPPGADPKAVLQALSGVKLSGARPKWQEWLKNWTDRLGESKETEKPKEAVNTKK